MHKLFSILQERFSPIQPLPAGVYTRTLDTQPPRRLDLRLEPDGSGIAILDASTVLHLNPTAAEYAYHIIRGDNPEVTASVISHRYRISRKQARQDFLAFQEQLHTLLETPDLAPDLYLGTESLPPYENLSAPLRLDCALTYRLPANTPPEYAPTGRVKRELETDEWKAILQKAWQAGIPHIVFTGGEPTLRDDLPELIACAGENGQVTGLCSLGLRLSDPPYRHTLLQTGLDHLLFLLQPETPASWHALETILPEDLFTTVHLTLTPDNVSAAEDYLRRLASLSINGLSLSAATPEVHPVLTTLSDLAANLGMDLIWDVPVPYGAANPIALEHPPDARTLEGAGRAWLYVEPDGDVLPAQGINRVLGNLLQDSWEDLQT